MSALEAHVEGFPRSYDTALCLIPPENVQTSINHIRNLYDKAYNRWPPHVNLIYPFVKPELLRDAVHVLCETELLALTPKKITLEEPDFFKQRDHNTIILRPQKEEGLKFASKLIEEICRKFGWSSQNDFQPHLTIGQSNDANADSHKFLMEKARLLAIIEWDIESLFVLVRGSTSLAAAASHMMRPMRLWGRVDTSNSKVHHDLDVAVSTVGIQEGDAHNMATFQFEASSRLWRRTITEFPERPLQEIRQLIVASYNVLAEFQWPPCPSRYPLIISNILSERAAADIIILQEVTDHFLPFLLQDPRITESYIFATHGPPGIEGSGPLPSLLNTVVLSKLPFSWKYLQFPRKHKGAAVLELAGSCTGVSAGTKPQPVILAACHLTQGLTDGAVISKRNELKKLTEHLSAAFPDNPWILAGDLNLASSSFSIDQARKKGHLSSSGYQCLREIDKIIADSELHDAWLLTRICNGVSRDAIGSSQSLEELHEGEQGATFDPLANPLAAKAIGGGGLYDRPQRYDRILFNSKLSLTASGFNLFGHPLAQPQPGIMVASDHWGIRCLFSEIKDDCDRNPNGRGGPALAIISKKAPSSLGKTDNLKSILASLGCLPTKTQREERADALNTLERVLCRPGGVLAGSTQRSPLDVILIPVGSYGLGVWDAESDIDCLCVGRISSGTFFSLALSKLKRANNEGVHVMRVVRAKTGTMLELSISGIMFDLQYCAAGEIVANYPHILNHPVTDPAFKLPPHTLLKLKAARDLAYLQRSIPDMAEYRLAHLFVKAWAKCRGLYFAKFGLLNGLNISVLLVPICKFLACNGGIKSTADILTTFFHHYADFDWKNDVVFDPFFHTNIKYHRTLREPLCLLGWHSPSLNTALNASPSTVHTLASEFVRAKSVISQQAPNWNSLLERDTPIGLKTLMARNASIFLRSFVSYIKIDARYWGPSPIKGRRFLGWLESRCMTVLIDANRRIPTLTMRIWPGSFAPLSSQNDDESEEYHCSYLVGLTWDSATAGAEAEAQKQDSAPAEGLITEQVLGAVLRDFESRICGDKSYFDPKFCWMMASVAAPAAVERLEANSQPWRGGDAGDTDSEEEFETDEDEEVVSAEEPEVADRFANIPRQAEQATAKPPGTGKLRTAIDVMNRLRWDPALDPGNYIIGYEDRFVGAREKALEQWKTEQTDEEFIPQHRILYFKRKSDDSIVWDRRLRIDTLFGSGH